MFSFIVVVSLSCGLSVAQVNIHSVNDQTCSGDDVTFYCNSTGSELLAWNLMNLPGVIGATNSQFGQILNATFERITSPDTSLGPNPSIITILNVTAADNGAGVQCGILNGALSEMISLVVGTPVAPITVSITPNEISWSPSMDGLRYRTSVCLEGTLNCPIETNCASCDSTPITGITESGNYNISVCSSSGDPCPSESCTSTLAELNATATISTPTTPPSNVTGPCIPCIIGGVVGGLVAVTLVVIIIIAVVIVIKHKQKMKPEGVKLTRRPGEEMATLREDTTYASPGTETAATEGADGVYSYAATTTVVGAKMDPKQKAGKKPSDETKNAKPDKPQRGNYRQQPPADVSHKQGPAGELYAMPEKKPQAIGHVQGPQGDMYAVSAKPTKGAYGAEGPH